MVTITDATLRQSVYENIYDTITSLYLISSTVTVTAAYVDSDELLPQVVVHSPEVGYSEFSFDRTDSDKEIRVLIDIFTKKAKDKDIIADAIMNSLSTTQYAGVQLNGVDESEALSPVGGLKIHLKSITLTYLRR